MLLERVNKPERGGGGVDVEMGGCHFTLQFNCIYCVYVWGEGEREEE